MSFKCNTKVMIDHFQYAKPGDVGLPSSLDQLTTSADLTVSQAERHFYNCDFRECYKLTQK